MEESELIRLAREGDRDAMERLYREHADRVYTVVRRLAGDEARADDLAQEAWIRAFEKLDLFRGRSSFGTWMYRLATNTALNRLRTDSRHRELEEKAAPSELHGRTEIVDEAVIDQKVLQDAMDRLPDGYRQVLVLHDVEGFTHAEIAEKLGVATGTSKSQLHKARARMRELIEPDEIGEEAQNDA